MALKNLGGGQFGLLSESDLDDKTTLVKEGEFQVEMVQIDLDSIINHLHFIERMLCTWFYF